MSFQPATGCASVAINGLVNGKAIANVLNFYFIPITYELADLEALGAAIDDVVGAAYLPLVHNGVSYVSTHVRGLTSIVDLESTTTTSAGAGSAGTSKLPANVSMCITLRSRYTGRSARGRFYMWPTVIDSLSSPAEFSNAYAGPAVDLVQGLIDVGAPLNWQPVILSRFSEGVKRLEAEHFPIISVSVRNRLVDSQRNRLVSDH